MKAKINRKNVIVITALTVGLLLLIAVSVFWGRYTLDINDAKSRIVLVNIRLPRIFLAVMVGCSLSTAGCVFQNVFHNPMAAPDILGASSGACFGAALAILLGQSKAMVTLMAFIFSLITITLVYIISNMVRGDHVVSMLLAGIMIGSLFSAGTSYVKLVADPSDQLPAITYWLMGSLANSTRADVIKALIPMSIGWVVIFLIRWRINLLTLSEDEAFSIGVNVKHLRMTCIVMASLLTSASISVSGMIGWVGLVIPHLARKMVGDNAKILIPVTMLLGGAFLLLVDDLARNLLATEIPIGILNAFLGVPFFIVLMMKGGNRK